MRTTTGGQERGSYAFRSTSKSPVPKIPSSVIVVVMRSVNELIEVSIVIFRLVDVSYVVVEVSWLVFGIVHDRTQHFLRPQRC